MLSRVADALFWMSRYYERAENTARLIDVNINMMLDMGDMMRESGSSARYWNPIIGIATPYEEFRARYPRTTQESAIEWLTFGEGNPNSIIACIQRARENARAMRGNISSEMWEHVNTTYLNLRDTSPSDIWREGPHSYFRRIRESSQLFHGLVETTMLRDEGWQWIKIGSFLERADATTRLVDVKYHILLPSLEDVGGPIDNVQWIAVLKSCSAYEAYQRRYAARITPSRVAEFLVLDPTFPRSVRFCFDQMHWALRSIGTEHGEMGEGPAEIVASNVRRMLEETTMNSIIQFGLHQYMVQLQRNCAQISGKITQRYFMGTLRHVA
jgi:uncharacterized alpha-E superfamily protein